MLGSRGDIMLSSADEPHFLNYKRETPRVIESHSIQWSHLKKFPKIFFELLDLILANARESRRLFDFWRPELLLLAWLYIPSSSTSPFPTAYGLEWIIAKKNHCLQTSLRDPLATKKLKWLPWNYTKVKMSLLWNFPLSRCLRINYS